MPPPYEGIFEQKTSRQTSISLQVDSTQNDKTTTRRLSVCRQERLNASLERMNERIIQNSRAHVVALQASWVVDWYWEARSPIANVTSM